MTKLWLSNTPPPHKNNRLVSKTYLCSSAGRSMVEMLSVLAIMGVISVITLFGFRTMMNKHKANMLVGDINGLAHQIMLDKQLNPPGNMAYLITQHNADSAFQLDPDFEGGTSQVFMLATKDKIDKDVCTQVANMGWKLPIATLLNGQQVDAMFASACQDENTLAFAFTNDLTPCEDCPISEVDCTPYANAECGHCDPITGYVSENTDCEENANGTNCVLGKCQPCPPGQAYNNGCIPCANINTTVLSDPENCHQCIDSENNPTHWLMYQQGIAYCIKCNNTTNGWSTNINECKRCSNRCLRRDNGQCGIPGTSGFGFTAYARDPQGSGYCVCTEGYYREADSTPQGSGKRCLSCSNIDVNVLANVEDCHTCLNSGGDATHWLMYQQGIAYCIKCNNTTNGWSTNINECKRCSNRCLRRDNGQCGIPGTSGFGFTAYALDPQGSGYCVCAEGYHMNGNNACVAN